MTHLILSNNNISNESLSSRKHLNLDWTSSEFSKALQNTLQGTQKNFTYFKFEEDDSVDEVQTQQLMSNWTLENQFDYLIPTVDWSISRLLEEREQYEITLKIFYLSEADLASKYVNDAIKLVLRKLDVKYVDLLIVSFPGQVSDESSLSDEEFDISEEEIREEAKVWLALTHMQEQGIVRKLGVADFNHNKLEKFLKGFKVQPQVNQLNIKNYYNLNPSLLKLARMENIELLAHNDCRKILPRIFPSGYFQHIDKATDLQPNSEQVLDSKNRKLLFKWAVKYTAVVRNRGVIESKGYFVDIKLLET